MKKPFIAFILSFILPGAGLAYLGKWLWAVLNFGGAILLGIVASFILPADTFESYAHMIGVGIAAVSAALAQALAVEINKEKAGQNQA